MRRLNYPRVSSYNCAAVRIKDGVFLGDEFSVRVSKLQEDDAHNVDGVITKWEGNAIGLMPPTCGSLYMQTQDYDFFDRNKITAIVNCAAKTVTNRTNKSLRFLSLPWIESDSQVRYLDEDCIDIILFDPESNTLEALIGFLRESEASSQGILIHSVKGVNRCACALIAYLLVEYRWSLANAIELIWTKKPSIRIQTSFLTQLQALEQHLLLDGDRYANAGNNIRDILEVKERDVLLRNTQLNAKTSLTVQQVLKRKIINPSQLKKDAIKLKWVDQANAGRLAVVLGVTALAPGRRGGRHATVQVVQPVVQPAKTTTLKNTSSLVVSRDASPAKQQQVQSKDTEAKSYKSILKADKKISLMGQGWSYQERKAAGVTADRIDQLVEDQATYSQQQGGGGVTDGNSNMTPQKRIPWKDTLGGILPLASVCGAPSSSKDIMNETFSSKGLSNAMRNIFRIQQAQLKSIGVLKNGNEGEEQQMQQQQPPYSRQNSGSENSSGASSLNSSQKLEDKKRPSSQKVQLNISKIIKSSNNSSKKEQESPLRQAKTIVSAVALSESSPYTPYAESNEQQQLQYMSLSQTSNLSAKVRPASLDSQNRFKQTQRKLSLASAISTNTRRVESPAISRKRDSSNTKTAIPGMMGKSSMSFYASAADSNAFTTPSKTLNNDSSIFIESADSSNSNNNRMNSTVTTSPLMNTYEFLRIKRRS